MKPETDQTTSAAQTQALVGTVTHSLLLVLQARRVAAALRVAPKVIADQALAVYRATGNRFEARRYLRAVAFAGYQARCAEALPCKP